MPEEGEARALHRRPRGPRAAARRAHLQRHERRVGAGQQRPRLLGLQQALRGSGRRRGSQTGAQKQAEARGCGRAAASPAAPRQLGSWPWLLTKKAPAQRPHLQVSLVRLVLPHVVLHDPGEGLAVGLGRNREGAGVGWKRGRVGAVLFGLEHRAVQGGSWRCGMRRGNFRKSIALPQSRRAPGPRTWSQRDSAPSSAGWWGPR